MSYQRKLKRHLAKFKSGILGIAEPGTYNYRGVDRDYDHILPLHQRESNLFSEAIPSARAFFLENPQKRHRNFHHLNSSQAFTFNLFFPYFSAGGEAGAMLLRAFRQSGIVTTWRVEDVPDTLEGSNIDVWWKADDGIQTFCEVKLSETAFGTAKLDEEHLTKLRTIYSSRLSGHVNPAQLEPKSFFKNYQFYRNIWHMLGTERSHLIFLLPRANSCLWKHLQHSLQAVAESTRARIDLIALEDVVESLIADIEGPINLRAHALQLKEKYLLRE